MPFATQTHAEQRYGKKSNLENPLLRNPLWPLLSFGTPKCPQEALRNLQKILYQKGLEGLMTINP